MDGKEIYENFTKGDTQGLRDAAHGVSDLSSAYLERGRSIKALQDRMSQAWTGSGADAANAGAGPLAQAFRETATPLDMTTASVDMQASSFDSSGHTVVPVPPKPESPSPWTTGLKAAIPFAGPFMAADDIKTYQQGVAKYNAANETNVRVMDQYNAVTDGTKSVLPTDFGVLKSDGAAISLKQPPTPPPVRIEHLPTKNEKKTGGGGDDDKTTTSGTTTTSALEHAKRVVGDQPVGSSPGDGRTQPPPVVTPPKVTPPRGKTDPHDDTTTPTGKQPGRKPTPTPPSEAIVPTPGRNGPGGGGFGDPSGTGFTNTGTGSGPGGRGTSAGGRLLSGEGAGSRGAGGETGGSRGALGENARGLGAGKGSGVGSLGSIAAQEAAAARAAAGGRGGQMGPMGAGGRNAEGEEDDEHHRPDFLIEPDPDALFGTDQRTSPPVIGE